MSKDVRHIGGQAPSAHGRGSSFLGNQRREEKIMRALSPLEAIFGGGKMPQEGRGPSESFREGGSPPVPMYVHKPRKSNSSSVELKERKM